VLVESVGSEFVTARSQALSAWTGIDVGVSLLPIVTESELPAYLTSALESLGFLIDAKGMIANGGDADKERIRSLHARHRAEAFQKGRDQVVSAFDDIIPYFVDGKAVNPLKVDAFVRPVISDMDASLFRAATMLWSVPVSQGYGRRNRFLVCDRQNGALIGVFALGDPVFNLSPRDQLIGWDHHAREKRLYRVFDAFVLGAVPPYREMLGGKLIALAAISNETRRYLIAKYSGKATNAGVVRDVTPVLVTTTSSLGRSSIYNRIKYGPQTLYYSVGYTKGFGHFHIPDDVFASMVLFLRTRGELPGNQYGDGPNWRMRVIGKALQRLGLNPKLVQHGIKREVFLAPLAYNWREMLRGEEIVADSMDLPIQDLSSFFVSRWAFPRTQRDNRYREVLASQTLNSILPGQPLQKPLIDWHFTEADSSRVPNGRDII
jgi:Domain of unknown function (DUF4338)